nr:acyl-CoA-dependent ceramide synthase [Kwoniella dejecticola CBS 10117]OBR86187.1 acyl-CoA-dependent ceramide synthase [Kwoniella dejecticola CBS 10117]
MTSSTLSTIPAFLQSHLPPSLHPFFTLSYPIHPKSSSFFRSMTSPHPGETLYDKGYKDIYISFSCFLLFTILRSLTMDYIFAPFANYIIQRNRLSELQTQSQSQSKSKSQAGLSIKQKEPQEISWKTLEKLRESRKERKKRIHTITRFSEQAWSWLYCTVYWVFGMFTLYSIPRPFSPEQLWGTYPYTPLPAIVKFYYLSQLGWWFHQIYVINSEKRRKDHWQMFGHHILTITLLVTSYIANFTRVGVVIHVLMDFCDIFLPLAKMLRYLSYTTSCDLTFVIFLISWLFSREIGLFLVIKTSYQDAPKHIKFNWSPSTGHYLTYNTYIGFIGLVTLLWVLASIWFYMAIKVAVKVVKGQGAEDSRSDDEDEDNADDSEDTILDEKDQLILEVIPQSGGINSERVDKKVQLNGHGNQNGRCNGNAIGKAGGGLKKRK